MGADDMSDAAQTDLERAAVAAARLQVLYGAAQIIGKDAVMDEVRRVVHEGTRALADYVLPDTNTDDEN